MSEYANANIINSVTQEQIKRFLSDEKTFFDSHFIQEYSKILFSNPTVIDSTTSRLIVDSILLFGKLSNKYIEIENKFGSISRLDPIDKTILNLSIDLSNGYLNKSNVFSPIEIRETFKNYLSDPNIKLLIDTDPVIREKLKNVLSSGNISNDNIESTQKILEAKLNAIDVVEQVQSYSDFITNGVTTCNNIDEFLIKFNDVIGKASTSLSTLNNSRNDETDMKDALTPKFFKKAVNDGSKKVKCGIGIIDALLNGGFDRERVYMFGGQTGGGKSTFISNLAYGMLKSANNIFFNESDIFIKASSDPSIMNMLENYIKYTNEKNKDNKRRLILYITLENTDDESLKRLVCRMGILPNIFWELVSRDKELENVYKEKGLNFEYNDLPSSMSNELRTRLTNISKLARLLLSDNNVASLKIIWKEPYTITSYDIFLMCKKYQRQGYIIDAVYIDYADKLRAVESVRSDGDQNWLELGKIFDNLKGLSKQVNAPVITVSQVNRAMNQDANAIAKKGFTSGSIQKEYNADMHANLTFKRNDDNVLDKLIKEFKNNQQIVSLFKKTMFNNFATNSHKDMESFYSTFSKISMDMSKASDIIQLRLAMPTVQPIIGYVTKNRDGVSDISFEMYIVYGIYIVTDFDDEAMESAKFACETYKLFIEYMLSKNIIDAVAYRSSVQLLEEFERNYRDYRRSKGMQDATHIQSELESHANNNQTIEVPQAPPVVDDFMKSMFGM